MMPWHILPQKVETAMSIASSMSRGFGIKEGQWCYLGEDTDAPAEIDQRLNAPKNDEQALQVARAEVAIRKSAEYIAIMSKQLKQNKPPPLIENVKAQQSALAKLGFSYEQAALDQYRALVAAMDVEKRKEIFFLKVNDTLFKPHIDPVGKIIVSVLHQLDGD